MQASDAPHKHLKHWEQIPTKQVKRFASTSFC